jgi:NADPH-dependent 2,4-dienoyl-CoA reductase/sulfur reductase-like enzyme
MHLLIIGGSDAGISAALRAQELDPRVEVTVAVADDFPNFSICGLPYYLSGETPDWRDLAHRAAFPGINILRRHTATRIDVARKSAVIDCAAGEKTVSFDRLIVATGATPIRPNLPGSDSDGVFLLHTIDDSFALNRHLSERHPETAVLIGAGYIGLEMADALRQRGLDVTLLSRSETVLPTIDPMLGRMVQEELQSHDVRVLTGVGASTIDQTNDGPLPRLLITDTAGHCHKADVVIIAVGVRPNSELAHNAGAKLGAKGAIAVNRYMQTSLQDVFAAGDCVETYHRFFVRPTYISLGTIAHKQGRVAGENAVGGERQFAGTLGTQSLKVFDLAVARTGLLDHEAREAGFDPLTVAIQADDHKAYYPGATPLRILMSGDRRTGKLLGAQILGHRKAEISKRIDIVAAALFQHAAVEELNDMDLSYTPPFSSPWDPVQMAAQMWTMKPRCPTGHEEMADGHDIVMLRVGIDTLTSGLEEA